MFELIRINQLNIMLFLCGACGILILLLLITRFLSKSRKIVLILMEFVALLLLWFDRWAYIYAGMSGPVGFYMVRISNFAVFFLTSGIVFGFNLYLMDWLRYDGKVDPIPFRMKVVQVLTTLGMLMAVIAAFTDLYYYFDESNRYHRGSGFLIAYIVPILCPILQYTVVRQYRKIFSKLIYVSVVLYIFVPIACGILQIFAYGISIVNMSMVVVSISLYIFTYLDINNTVERAHEIEIQNMLGVQKRVQTMFDGIIMGLVSEIEEKDGLNQGNALRAAEYSKQIAVSCGKDEEYGKRTYYVTLFYAVGLFGVVRKVMKLTEEEASEMQRMAQVSYDYVRMTTGGDGRNAIPDYVARESIIREAGETYDLAYANLMVKILNAQDREAVDELLEIESGIRCGAYRDHISKGIEIATKEKRICFDCEVGAISNELFGAPSLVLFDSYDRRVHGDEKTIQEYRYLEYGELWFDGHSVSTAARRIHLVANEVRKGPEANSSGKEAYEIRAVRFEDHVRIQMIGPSLQSTFVVALPDKALSFYIGLTGESCKITNTFITSSDEEIGEEEIARIVQETSYIDCLESDIKNVQIDRTRSAASEGIEIQNRLQILFHSMSLPTANLIWHCPAVVIYSSADGNVFGTDYREYAFIKLTGEDEDRPEYAQNKFKMKRKEDFLGWENWKTVNKEGLDYEMSVEKKGNRILLKATNLGIEIENITVIQECPEKVYVALTGDQVALTDIRIK